MKHVALRNKAKNFALQHMTGDLDDSDPTSLRKAL